MVTVDKQGRKTNTELKKKGKKLLQLILLLFQNSFPAYSDFNGFL